MILGILCTSANDSLTSLIDQIIYILLNVWTSLPSPSFSSTLFLSSSSLSSSLPHCSFIFGKILFEAFASKGLYSDCFSPQIYGFAVLDERYKIQNHAWPKIYRSNCCCRTKIYIRILACIWISLFMCVVYWIFRRDILLA